LEASREFVEAVPQEWRVGMLGEVPPSPQHRHHVTLLARIPRSHRAALLAAIAQERGGVEAAFGSVFVSPVERIRQRKVLCVGLRVVSPQLRALRERLAAASGGDLRYSGDGHVSVCYVAAEHAAQLQRLLDSDHPAAVALRRLAGSTFLIDVLSINLGPDAPELVVPIGSSTPSLSSPLPTAATH